MNPEHDVFDVEPGLLRARPQMVYVELSSRCNLRCVYCAVSQPDYHGEEMLVDIDALGDLLVRLQPGEVQISGHGETTMLRDWAQTARKLAERGLALTITSNLAKSFDDGEIDVLSRMQAVKISIDSADEVSLARLRRGAKLHIIESNLQRIVQRCRDEFRELPYLHLSCTVTDVNVSHLADLVRWAHRQHAHAVGLLNLVRYPQVAGAIPTRHPVEVDAAAARRHVADAQRAADELGIRFDMEPGFVESLREAGDPCR